MFQRERLLRVGARAKCKTTQGYTQGKTLNQFLLWKLKKNRRRQTNGLRKLSSRLAAAPAFFQRSPAVRRTARRFSARVLLRRLFGVEACPHPAIAWRRSAPHPNPNSTCLPLHFA